MAPGLEAFADVEHELAGLDDIGEIGSDGAHDLRRYAQDDEPRALDGGAHLPGRFHPVVEAHVIQVAGVQVLVTHLLQDIAFDAPETHPVAVGGGDLGERGAHVSSAQDGN